MDPVLKFSPDKVFFTSDTHFGHQNIIRFCNRPFKNASEMDAELIRRWQEVVPHDGFVFHLGDFCFGSATHWNRILSSLPGRKFLIIGNHDMKSTGPDYTRQFEMVTQQMIIRVGSQLIMLNHYPLLCYGGSYKDVWQLFGHVHSGPVSQGGLDIPRLRMLFPLQYDVGVDNNDYRPISFAQVRAKIQAQIKASRAAAGIVLDGPTPDVFRVAFLDEGTSIDPPALDRLKKAATNIIYLNPADPTPLKEVISIKVSLFLANIRFVYIGSRPFDDFRYVAIAPKSSITLKNVDDAVGILL